MNAKRTSLRRLALIVLATMSVTTLIGLAGPSAAPAEAAPTVSPVATYTFDGDSGATVTDASGNGLNATWIGTPSYVSGVSGSAVAVSSGKNYVKLPLVAGKTDASASFSYEFWMQLQSRTSYGTLMSNQNFVSCNNAGITLYNQTTPGVLQACWGQTAGGTKEYLNGATPNIQGTWHHIAVTVDRTANQVKIYTDGALTATSPAGYVNANTKFASGLAFNIGGFSGSETDSADGYTNALIDTLSFYNDVVPASQVAADYAAQKPLQYTIAFDGNGATGGSTASQLLVGGQTATLRKNGFTRNGFLFQGWAASPAGPIVYTDAQNVTDLAVTPDATVTLYAVWAARPATTDGSTLAQGFVSSVLRAPSGRVGETVSQSVAGLWIGTAPTSFTKTDGDDWLSVSADGVVTGTVPEAATEFPGWIDVSATNGTTTSLISVEVPGVAIGAPVPLDAVTWDLWDGGSHVDDARLKNLAVIAENGFDVIGVQHDGGTGAEALATALGWHAVEGPDGTGVVSPYPLTERVDAQDGAPAFGVTADVWGQDIRVWSVALDSGAYGPDAACDADPADPATLIETEKATLRFAQAEAVTRSLQADVASAARTALIVLGDLQSPAGTDWTADTAAARCTTGAVDWPVPAAFAAAGLTDAFRTANPDLADRGDTWSPIIATHPDGSPQPQDRIDYVHFAGAPLTLDGANTVVAGWPSKTNIIGNAWASNHRAVVGSFRLGPPVAAVAATAENAQAATDAGVAVTLSPTFSAGTEIGGQPATGEITVTPTDPVQGTWTVSGSDITFTPSASADDETVTATYTVSSSNGTTASATLTVVVTSPAVPATASASSAVTDPGRAVRVVLTYSAGTLVGGTPATATVELVPDDPALGTWDLSDQASTGVLAQLLDLVARVGGPELASRSVVFTPADGVADATATATFTVSSSNGTTATSTATVSIGSVTAAPSPTGEPTGEPTTQPTGEPTSEPTGEPTGEPTTQPTSEPTGEPTTQPTSEPTGEPTTQPTSEPTGEPTTQPTSEPTAQPTGEPTGQPTGEPTGEPTTQPTGEPTGEPTTQPTGEPTGEPTTQPTGEPTTQPTGEPTANPSVSDSVTPSAPSATSDLPSTGSDASALVLPAVLGAMLVALGAVALRARVRTRRR